MSEQTLCLYHKGKLQCGSCYPAPVILCVEQEEDVEIYVPALILEEHPASQIFDNKCLWHVTLKYDDTDLPDPEELLEDSDVVGIVCIECRERWLQSLIEDALTEVAVTDTSSINLTITPPGGTQTLSGTVVISDDAGNILETRVDGLYVPETVIDISADPGNTLSELGDGLYADGQWIPLPTCTYVSATSMTVVGDYTAVVPVGSKLRLKQGGGYKYFYIISAVFAAGVTTFGITAGIDFTLANAAITDAYFSVAECPIGHPCRFDFDPVLSGFSSDPTDGAYEFTLVGRRCTVRVVTALDGVSNSIFFGFDVPIISTTDSFSPFESLAYSAVNNGSTLTQGSVKASLATGDVNVSLARQGATWTASGAKAVNVELSYWI